MGSAPVVIRAPSRPVHKPPRIHLRGLGREQLLAWVQDRLGGPSFRGAQLFEWIHRHRVHDFDAMTNLPRDLRARLPELATLEPLEQTATAVSADGTRKLRLRTSDGESIECVLIPNDDRGFTVCVSSMVGCCLTCRFCATASLGFVRNLATWEIVDQVHQAQSLLANEVELRADADDSEPGHAPRLTNVVFMGMGEPLHNYNHVRQALQLLTDEHGTALAGRRITVSTAGFVPGIERFAQEGLGAEIGLAVSLNATTNEVRNDIMPINTRWPIEVLLDAVRQCPTPRRRLVTFEYVLLAGVNDSPADARRLVELLQPLQCQVNVIPFNPHPHAPYRRPTPQAVDEFVTHCRARGLPAFLRRPRGDDIAAACGQLALEAT